MGWKEVFLKAIMQAIPTYPMHNFKLSNTLCRELENLISRFWWRSLKTNKDIHWCDWQSMCILKTQGNDGFKDFTKFNIALLTKQGWKLITNPLSLFARVFKAKYYPHDDFLSARLGSYPSFIWQSIWGARSLLKKGLGWRIGNGKRVNIWNDVWLPKPGNEKVMV